MTAVLSEGALDLSSKPFDCKPPVSPAHSIGSDLDLKCERPSSVSSEGDEVIHSPPKKRPFPQAFSLEGMPPMKSPRGSPDRSPGSLTSTPRSSPAASSPTGPGIDSSPSGTHAPANGSGHSPTSGRPFKMYPFEPVPNMYSQLAAAASTGMYGYGTASPTSGMPGMSLFDSAISLSSPIGQYLQQKKRRMESRQQMQSHQIPELNGGGGGVGSVGIGGGSIVPTSEHLPHHHSIHNSHHHNHHQAKASSPGSAPSSGTSALDDSDMLSDHGGDNKSVCSDGESSSSSMVLTPGGMKKIKPVPDNKKDEAYWERRRKNNEAAKRSRDARRAKEEEIALRAAFLEQENLKLRAQVAILKNETAKLHYMLYNRM